ncbi:MAG: hypothetical protein GDA55_00910 [Cellvibrionales bacterium]|nr:hypothetical protein [Cellvibrionales bacterium]
MKLFKRIRLPALRRPIVRYLARAPLVTLVLMAFCFLMFGYFSFNIFVLLQENIRVIHDFGLMALMDGAARQLLEIIFNAFASAAFFSGWKVCERLIVDWTLRE